MVRTLKIHTGRGFTPCCEESTMIETFVTLSLAIPTWNLCNLQVNKLLIP